MSYNIITLSSKQPLKKYLSNLPQGDVVVLDIDDTLLRNPVKKYGDRAPTLTEPGLPQLLRALKDSDHQVILLTARQEQYREITIQQLKGLGLNYDTLLHAPHLPELSKGDVLVHYLETQPKEWWEKCSRVLVFDDKQSELESVSKAFALKNWINKTLKLYHYQASAQTLDIASGDFPQDLSELHNPQSLGGGSNSTFRLEHKKSGKAYVLKYGAHQDHIKIEILINRLYRALGVAVPDVQAYNHVPKALAAKLNAHLVQLAPFFVHNNTDEATIIKQVHADLTW